MRSFFATLRQLVIPAGARAGTPRTVIGPDVPQALTDYYGAVLGGVIQENDQSNYAYDVLVVTTLEPPYGDLTGRARGLVVAGTVRELTWEEVDPDTDERRVFLAGRNTGPPVGFAVVDEGNRLDIRGGLIIDNVSAGRGLVGWAWLDSTVTPAGVGETEFLSTDPITFKAGRAYEVRLSVDGDPSTSAANVARWRLRLDDDGSAFADWQQPFPSGGDRGSFERSMVVTTDVDRTTAINASITATAAVIAVAQTFNRVGFVWVRDVGLGADYPGAYDM